MNADIQSVKVILVSEVDHDVKSGGRKGARRTRECRNGGGDRQRGLSRDRHSRPQIADPVEDLLTA